MFKLSIAGVAAVALAAGSAAAWGQVAVTNADGGVSRLAAYSSSLDKPLLPAADSDASPAGGGQCCTATQHTYGDQGWMSHLTWEGGGGFTAPLAGAGHSVNTGWQFTGGLGYNFVQRFGILGEYQFNRFGLTQGAIDSAGYGGQNVSGNTHLWSLTLEPIFRYKVHGKFGGYVIGGGGFYRALTSFTTPVTGIYCDPFYGCYPYPTDAVISHFSSNQGGMNVGLGFTYKFSSDSRLALYSEARYEWVNTPGHSSELVPVTFGVRF